MSSSLKERWTVQFDVSFSQVNRLPNKFIFFEKFRYGYYVLVECIHEHQVCVEDNVKKFLGISYAKTTSCHS